MPGLMEILKGLLPDRDDPADQANSILAEQSCLPANVNSDGNADEKIETRETILQKIYSVKQLIEIFVHDFPDEYNDFKSRIREIEEKYNSSLISSKEILTFEINPEISVSLYTEVESLRDEVRTFVDGTVAFNTLCIRLQKLIVALNLIYNTSVFHPRKDEQILAQIERAVQKEDKLIQEYDQSDRINSDLQFEDKFVNYISYIDFMILKTKLRNSDCTPSDAMAELKMHTEFKNLDCTDRFKTFLLDELNNMEALVSQIADENIKAAFEDRLTKLKNEIAYSMSFRNLLCDDSFWDRIFAFETDTFQQLTFDGVEHDKISIRILERMEISVDLEDILSGRKPKALTYITLLELYSENQENDELYTFIRFFRKLSDSISYKDIYRLLSLFEVMHILQENNSDLLDKFEKYMKKHPYTLEKIRQKKRQVLKSMLEVDKTYYMVFDANDVDDRTVQTLENLELDIRVDENGRVYINSFYFEKMNGVTSMFNNKTGGFYHEQAE